MSSSNNTANKLAQIQQQFFKGMCSTENDEVIGAELFTAKPKLSAAAQVKLYRLSSSGGLMNAMAETYAVIKTLIGEDAFNKVTDLYTQAHIPSKNNLNEYGEDFAEFLQECKPLQELPYLADTARLAWAWHQAFIAKDDAQFDFQVLAQLSAQQQQAIGFQLSHSATLLHSSYPLLAIWQLATAEDPESQAEINLDVGEEYLLVWRKGYELRIESIPSLQWQMLQAMQRGLSFAKVCERLLEQDAGVDISALLSESLQNGWVASFI